MERLLRALASELPVVLLIGLVSTSTAWAAIQASYHDGDADKAYGDYQIALAEANIEWITAEVKFRADLLTWDTEIGGSNEYYTYALKCREASESQLTECIPYMDAVYSPYNEAWDAAQPYIEESEIKRGYSDRLQMLTGIFAVSLFLLGITSPMQRRKYAAYLVAFAGILWAIGLVMLVSIPIIL